jgi:hypothetical protein
MNTTERLVIYSGLAASLLLGLVGRMPSSGSVAVARPAATADAARIASLDVLAVVERMISNDVYKPQREAYEADQAKKLQPMADELQKIKDEAKDLKEESERFKALNTSFVEKNNAFNKLRSEAGAAVELYNTNQVGEAYRLVIEAATRIADSAGYTHIIASKGGPTTIASRNIPGAVQEILARPLIKGVAADDLTDRLIKELKLENVVLPTNPTPAAGAAQPLSTAPAKVETAPAKVETAPKK